MSLVARHAFAAGLSVIVLSLFAACSDDTAGPTSHDATLPTSPDPALTFSASVGRARELGQEFGVGDVFEYSSDRYIALSMERQCRSVPIDQRAEVLVAGARLNAIPMDEQVLLMRALIRAGCPDIEADLDDAVESLG